MLIIYNLLPGNKKLYVEVKFTIEYIKTPFFFSFFFFRLFDL